MWDIYGTLKSTTNGFCYTPGDGQGAETFFWSSKSSDFSPCLSDVLIPGCFALFACLWWLIGAGVFTFGFWSKLFSRIGRLILGIFNFVFYLVCCCPVSKEGLDELGLPMEGVSGQGSPRKKPAVKAVLSDAQFIDPLCGTCTICTENLRCSMKVWRILRAMRNWLRAFTLSSVILGAVVLAFNVLLVILPANSGGRSDKDDVTLKVLLSVAPAWHVMVALTCQGFIAWLINGLIQQRVNRIAKREFSVEQAHTFSIKLMVFTFAFAIASVLRIQSIFRLWDSLIKSSGHIYGQSAPISVTWDALSVICWLLIVVGCCGLVYVYGSMKALTRAVAQSSPGTPPVSSSVYAAGTSPGNATLEPFTRAVHRGERFKQAQFEAASSPSIREGEASVYDLKGALVETDCGCACCSPSGYFKVNRIAPESRASIISLIIFSWMSPLISLGHSRALDQGDLFELPPSEESDRVGGKFASLWEEEHRKKGEKSSLMICCFRLVQRTFVISGLYKIVYDTLTFAGPVLLNYLTQFLMTCEEVLSGKLSGEDAYVGHLFVRGMGAVLLLAIANLVQTALLHQYFHRQFRIGIQMRSAVIVCIYNKSLRTPSGSIAPASLSEDASKSSSPSKSKSKNAKKEKGADDNAALTTGEIVNLMSIDAQRLQEIMPYIHTLWSSPYQIVFALVLLWFQIGWSTFAGVAVMCVSIPVTAAMAKALRRVQQKMMKIKDERIKLTNEVLAGVEIIKMYAWEESFNKRLEGVRREELRMLWKYQLYSMGQRTLWTAVPVLVSLVSFLAFVLSGNELTAAKAFTALSLFTILRFPLNVLPTVVTQLAETSVALGRIRKFLLRQELTDLPPPTPSSITDREEPSVIAKNLSLRWPNGSPLLEDISFTATPHTVTAIIGPTGCGKSGLLLSLIGDIKPQDRTIEDGLPCELTVKGRLAYVAQTAWIQNGTLRENITFGRPFIPAWYTRVVYACALRPDFDILPAGDQTEIGEKGVNLSGGQKQRVSLARAVYQAGDFPRNSPDDLPADVYLLDDCLSAVDSHVAKHIVEKCVMGILRKNNRTVILVTHKVDILSQVDQIVFLSRSRLKSAHQRSAAISAPDLGSVPYDSVLAEARTSIPPLETQEATVCRAVAIGPYNKLQDLPEFQRFTTEVVQQEAKAASGSIDLRSDASGASLQFPNLGGVTDDGDPQLGSPAADVTSAHTRSSPSVTEAVGSLDHHSPVTMTESTGPRLALEGRQLSLKSLRSRNSSIYSSRRNTFDETKHRLPAPNKDKSAGGGIIESEFLELGAVGGQVYAAYFRGAGGAFVIGLVLGTLALSQVSSVASNSWLSYWSDNSNNGVAVGLGIGVYAALSVGQILLYTVTSFMLIVAAQRASVYFHHRLLSNLLRAPMSFFDSTPLGRVINRFSKDMYTVDQVLPSTMSMYITQVFSVTATMAVIVFATPWFAAILVPLCWFYLSVQNYYIPCNRQLQRIDSILRSPIFAHFAETLDGVTTIRAYRAQARFRDINQSRLDSQQQANYLFVSANRWLATRLEFVGTMVVTISALLAVYGGLAGTISPGVGGLAISYALSVTQSLNWMVRMASDRESNIVSVERILEYAEKVPQEADSIVPTNRPPPEWPQKGAITFNGYQMRYRDGLPLVLMGLDLNILSEEKVGIVGRTGAGKSSLLLGLFRLVEPAGGSIEVDGFDLSTIGLFDLRSKFSIIPQDPVLFTGTLRFNLDPFDKYTDGDVWQALERSHLSSFVLEQFPGELMGLVEEGGRNISMGQRQLICLARALLRKSKILLLDEATSAVDPLTDQLIQQTIRREFNHCTILTIAHRLGTVIDYDKILVLESGSKAEYDAPQTLLRIPGGHFQRLCEDAGISATDDGITEANVVRRKTTGRSVGTNNDA